MTSRHDLTLDRRQFLTGMTFSAFAAGAMPVARAAAAGAAEDAPNTHNMLIAGERTIFLSHLPMFAGVDKSKTAFRSPHRYQVILEATFANKGDDASGIYFKDRQAHPDVRIYTLNPDSFVITRLFAPDAKPRLTEFDATVFRGHLEQGGTPVSGLDKTRVRVTRVVHGRMFDPTAVKPTALEYVLFGRGTERFLAHAIVGPPDFDQVIAVKVTGRELTDKDLAEDIRVTIPSRKNTAADRLREAARVDASLRVGGSSASDVQIETGVQLYFEEGELLVPPTFDDTAEEKKKELPLR